MYHSCPSASRPFLAANMPPRKQIGVPSTAPTRRSSRVAAREATTTPEPAHPPSLKATKASASATPKPRKSSTVRHRPRRRSPRTQAAIEEELAGEVHDAAAGQDASEERKASAVDSFDWSTLTRGNQFCYGNEEEHISVGTGFHLPGTNKHIPSQYPSPCNMRFEVQSGNSKIKKSGGVRIIGGADGIKMIPFVNIGKSSSCSQHHCRSSLADNLLQNMSSSSQSPKPRDKRTTACLSCPPPPLASPPSNGSTPRSSHTACRTRTQTRTSLEQLVRQLMPAKTHISRSSGRSSTRN